MGFTELFFSAQGRAPRLPSLIAAAVLLGLAALYEAAVEDPLAQALSGVFAYPALF